MAFLFCFVSPSLIASDSFFNSFFPLYFYYALKLMKMLNLILQASLFKHTSLIFHIFLCPYTWNYWYLELRLSWTFILKTFVIPPLSPRGCTLSSMLCILSLESSTVWCWGQWRDVWRALKCIWFSAVGRERGKGKFSKGDGAGEKLGLPLCSWAQKVTARGLKMLHSAWNKFCAEHLVAAGTKLLVTFFGISVFSAADWDMKSGFYGQSLRRAPHFHSNMFVVNMLGIFFPAFISPSAFSFCQSEITAMLKWWEAKF